MIFELNGVDFSDCVQYTRASETLRNVEGRNAGKNLLGGKIHDYRSSKYDLTINVRPVKSERLSDLAAALAAANVEVTYFSGLKNQDRTVAMSVQNLPIVLMMLKQAMTVPVYSNASIVLEED